ncbi:hypothetical protein B0H11DRAFT_1913095 [Mycena galericulata]|nr:hypothetical protein B0H11DRAFT_1913095 [Mycena galericulata]
MDAKTTLVNNSSLFSPTSSLPAFPSLLPLSSYDHSQTYPTLAATPLQVQQVVLVLRPFTVDIAYGGAFDAVELGLPDGLSLVFTRAVFETCFSNHGSNADLQGRRHAHVRRAHPHSLSSRAARHPLPPIFEAILIPKPELKSAGAADVRVNFWHNAIGGRLLHDVWAHDLGRFRCTQRVMHMAVPTVMTVCDLRHIDWCSADTLSPRLWVDVNVDSQVMYSLRGHWNADRGSSHTES